MTCRTCGGYRVACVPSGSGELRACPDCTVTTPLGVLRPVVLDGVRVAELRCPMCGEWAYLDEDQFHGRVSVDHTDAGCSYHETHDFAAALQEEEG